MQHDGGVPKNDFKCFLMSQQHLLFSAMSQASLQYSGFGVVTRVLSGDTLVLRGVSVDGNPTPTMEIVLSGIMAPRLAR